MRYKNRKPKSLPKDIIIAKITNYLNTLARVTSWVDYNEEPTRIDLSINFELGTDIEGSILEDGIDFLREKLHNWGWFVENIGATTTRFVMELESYTGEEVVPERYLYHYTDIFNVSKIKKRGLIPELRSTSVKQGTGADLLLEPRIYLNSTLESMLDLPEDVGIFEVDTEKLRRGVKFYRDPTPEEENFDVLAVWTKSHIPPKALTYLGSVSEIEDEIQK